MLLVRHALFDVVGTHLSQPKPALNHFNPLTPSVHVLAAMTPMVFEMQVPHHQVVEAAFEYMNCDRFASGKNA